MLRLNLTLFCIFLNPNQCVELGQDEVSLSAQRPAARPGLGTAWLRGCQR